LVQFEFSIKFHDIAGKSLPLKERRRCHK